MTNAIVLAAGKGTRMKTDHSKTMHTILGVPMVGLIYDTLKKVGVDDIVFVVGHGREEIQDYLQDKVTYAVQMPQLGSGHAVMQATALKGKPGKTLIINGDCPLITVETYRKLLEMADESSLVLLTTVLQDAGSYGRIVRNSQGGVERIVELKDCNEQEVAIREVNAGIYCVNNELLWQYLKEIRNNNAQKEYYVTDLVEIFRSHGLKVGAYCSDDFAELSGVNNRRELAQATGWLRNRINNGHMDNGVTITSPETVFISPDVVIGNDTTIYGNVRIEGKTVIGKDCIITEGSYIADSELGNNVEIISSRIIRSHIGSNNSIGPWEELKNENIDEIIVEHTSEYRNESAVNTDASERRSIRDRLIDTPRGGFRDRHRR